MPFLGVAEKWDQLKRKFQASSNFFIPRFSNAPFLDSYFLYSYLDS
jgi:hypothetical protein